MLAGTCAPAQPDIIVGAFASPVVVSAGPGDIALSFAITLCNVGTAPIPWVATTNNHPVVRQSLYRLDGGRFRMIGHSWMKHEFAALSMNACGSCPAPTGPSSLAPACSTTSSASVGASQSSLGPPSDLNSSTGAFPFPFTAPAITGPADRRLRVHPSAVDPTVFPSARYVAEVSCITSADAGTPRARNNASWREVARAPTPSPIFSALGETVPGEPALCAWKTLDPGVSVRSFDVPGDGRFWLASRVWAIGPNLYRHEIALLNSDSDRAAESLSVSLPPNSQVTDSGFHDISHHSGELQNALDWTFAQAPNGVAWVGLESFASNPNANALRFGTMYNFWFTADAVGSDVMVGLFKPGTPTSFSFPGSLAAIWQVNQASARLAVMPSFPNMPHSGPMVATLPTNTPAMVEVGSLLMGQPFNIWVSSSPAVPAISLTASLQAINVDLGNGGFLFPRHWPATPQPQPFPSPGFSLAFSTTPVSSLTTAQMLVADPSKPEGYALSAANEVRVN